MPACSSWRANTASTGCRPTRTCSNTNWRWNGSGATGRSNIRASSARATSTKSKPSLPATASRPPRSKARPKKRSSRKWRMLQTLTDSRLANVGAQAICDAFDAYHAQFKTITRRARTHFERRDWHAMQRDAAARLDLYAEVIGRIVAEIRELLGERDHDKLVWASIKAVYSGLIAARDDWELAETFFNSVSRRIFTTVGVDRQIEFVDSDFDTPPTASTHPTFRTSTAPGCAALAHDAD